MSNEIQRIGSSGSQGQTVPTWNNPPQYQNPTGLDFSVLCEGCEFLLPNGACLRNQTNSRNGGEYPLTKGSNVTTMNMSFKGMMKSYNQARRILEDNPSLRRDSDGGVLSLDDSLRIDDREIVRAKRKLLLTRLAVWSNPVGWIVNLDTALADGMTEGLIGRAKRMLGYAVDRTLYAKGTDIGVATLSQVIRLNCARINRAKVDNAKLAEKISSGQTWVIRSDELINPDELR